MNTKLKQRIYLSWADRPMGVLFELDGNQAQVSNVDFQKRRRPDDVQITIQGHMGTVNQYNITLPKPEPTPAQ
jgi:hypothetical protein